MTEDDVKRIARETLAEMLGADGDAVGVLTFRGAVSTKMVAEGVRDAAMQRGLVLVDLRACSSIGGKRPWWRR